MKVINFNKSMLAGVRNSINVGDDGSSPCWYVNREDDEWIVGVAYPGGDSDEYSLKQPLSGKNKKLASRMLEENFALDLLDTFKDGGQRAVEEWVKKNCP